LFERASVLQRQEDRLIASNSASDINGRYSASGNYKIFASGRVERHHEASIRGSSGGSVHSTYLLVVVDRNNTVLWAMRHQERRGHDSTGLRPRPSTRTWRSEAQMPRAVADSIRTGNAVVHFVVTADASGNAAIESARNQLERQVGQIAVRDLATWLTSEDSEIYTAPPIASNSASDVNGRYSASGSYRIFASGRVERHHSASIIGRPDSSVHSTYVLAVVDRSGTVLWAMRHMERIGHDSTGLQRPRTRTWTSEAQMPRAIADRIRAGTAVVHFVVDAAGSPSARWSDRMRERVGDAVARGVDAYLRRHDL